MNNLTAPHHVRDRRSRRVIAALQRPTLRRWGPAVLTLLAAAVVVGGLVRLATDDRVVEVVSFAEVDQDLLPVAAALRAASAE